MNHKKPKRPCSIPGCSGFWKCRGLCQKHYDQWYGKIRRERYKQRDKDKPFWGFENPYRNGTGYNILFQVLRESKPLTIEQITRLGKIALVKAGMKDYRIDYALEVLKAKQHSSKKGDYQIRFDEKKRWHLIQEKSKVE